MLGLLSLAAPFLEGGSPPTAAQEAYLDWGGNRNTAYDIGDFRAYVQAHPDAPETTSEATPAGAVESFGTIRVPPVELTASSGEGPSEGDSEGGTEGPSEGESEGGGGS